MLAEKLEIARQTKEAVKTVDIRPALYSLTITEDSLLMVLGLGEGGYARPNEVAMLLLDGDEARVAALPYHRKDMYRCDEQGRIIDAMDV